MEMFFSNKLQKICISFGFTPKGKTYFRIIGDGVLQVIKCKYQRALQAEIIYIGLFSMYDCLSPQWFTASGCHPRYSILNCYYQNNMPLVLAVPKQIQLDMLADKVLPWLDTIDTQKGLSRAINMLDRRWNDARKIAPYLACGELNHAKKVVREILAQHDYSRMNRLQYHEDSSGQWILQREQEDDDLRCLFAMIEGADFEGIDHYLKSNYSKNIVYSGFLYKSSK